MDLTRHDRSLFYWNISSITACLVLTAFSCFAWLSDDIGAFSKQAVEIACCAALILDFLVHHRDGASLTRPPIPHLISVLAFVPWYTIVTSTVAVADEATLLFLSHASYGPYLWLRYRAHSKEHVPPRHVRLTLIFLATFFCLHWMASLWMVIRPTPGVDFSTEYNLALYFLTTTVTTIGYGDITPNDNLSRLFTMGLQVVSVCIFGVVIGQVSRLILNADKRREHAKNQMESLVSLFRHYRIPPDLQKKSYRFLSHVLTHAANEDEERVLAALPQGLQTELRTYMNMKPISEVSLFKGCSDQCHIETAKELKQLYFTPGQSIIKKGEIGDAMFLIGHGRVDVHDGESHIAHLSDGQVFGEMALIADERRGADVTAATHCDVYVLNREKFQHLMTHHADLRNNIDRVVSSRRRSTKQAS